MQQMTHEEAKRKLKQYFAKLELLGELGITSSSIAIVIDKNILHSKTETCALKIVEYEEELEEITRALDNIPERYRLFLELRFKHGFSGRYAADIIRKRRVHNITHPHRFEPEAISAFISALGHVPVVN